MLLISVFYINNNFEKWFSQNTLNVLSSSLEVVNQFYKSEEERNLRTGQYYLNNILPGIVLQSEITDVDAEMYRKSMSIDGLEIYKDSQKLSQSIDETHMGDKLKPIKASVIAKVSKTKEPVSYLDQYQEGSLLRTVLSESFDNSDYTIILSSYIPVAFGSRRQEISEAYKNLSQEDAVSYPLKSVYVFILILMTAMIMLGATWFGFYLARQISVPLELLGETAEEVAKGNYQHLDVRTGSPEINRLVTDFNKMTSQLEETDNDLRKVNSDLKRTLINLDEGRRYIQDVLSDVSTGVVSVNARGVVTMINKHAEEVLGINKENLVGSHYLKILDPKYATAFEEMFSQIKRSSKNRAEREINLSVNEMDTKPVKVTLSLLSDDSENDLGFVVTFDDLTDVLKAQRVTAWTEVAKRIAHEVKNPLTPISLSAQRLRKKFSQDISDPAFGESIEMIIDQTENLKKMVNEFSQFARLPKTDKKNYEINQVIKSSVLVFEDSHPKIKFTVGLGDPTVFLFDRSQISRVLINIIGNAVAAVSESSGPAISVDSQISENQMKITVSDNGVGIDSATVGKIFEPYVTTKKKGTGLGLSIVKRIVEDHGGDIKVESKKGSGTKVAVRLPLRDLVS